MPTLEPIPERTNREFSILHNPLFKSKETTPLWAQTWTAKPVTCSTEYLAVHRERPQFYSNQQIYKEVIQWFESWRPWQQRTLLCGLTNRFHYISFELFYLNILSLFANQGIHVFRFTL